MAKRTCRVCDLELVGDSFLLFTDPYHKQVYQLPTVGGDDALSVVRGVAMPTDAQFPISVDVLADRGLVYWIDSTASRIMSTDFTKDQHSIVAQLPPGKSNNGKPSGSICDAIRYATLTHVQKP